MLASLPSKRAHMADSSNWLPISVVIPAYNRAQYVVEAVRSVQAQTRTATEVIVVDDGSTDDTAQAARAAGASVIRQANSGLPAARNTGIMAATNPWIAFLDDDDLWEPTKLARQWQLIERCPRIGFAFTDHSAFNEEGSVFASLYAEHPERWAQVQRHPAGPGLSVCETEDALRRFYRWNFVNVSSLLIRRDLLLHIGLFDASLKAWEDWEITLRLFGTALGGVVEEPLVRRRRHATQMTGDRLHMKLHAAAATMRIVQRPWLYPKSAAKFYRNEPARWFLEAGELLMSTGRYAEARSPLLRSLRLRLSLRTARHYLKALRLSRTTPKPGRVAERST